MSVDRAHGIRRFTSFVREPVTRIRFFSSASDAARARRPTDAVMLLASIVALTLASVVPQDGTLVVAVTNLVRALPGLLGWFWESCDVLGVVWAIALVVAALVGRGRLALLRDQIAAVVIASLVGTLLLEGDASFASAQIGRAHV